MANPTVGTFLDGLFDYAGLFPPAGLSMEDAVHHYIEYRDSADRFMLGPFVIPMGRLSELRAFSNLFDPTDPFPLDVLLPGDDSADEFSREIPLQLANCRMFADRHPVTRMDAFETRLPVDILTTGRADRIFEAVSEALAFAGYGKSRMFVEIQRGPTFTRQVPVVFDSLAGLGENARIAAKIRCGGMEADDFPSTEEIAFFVRHAVRTGHPFKATAGLHHPVRHHSDAFGTYVHGFLNVFFAAAIAQVHGLEQSKVEEIIGDEDAESFVFDDDSIRWRDLEVDIEELGQCRRNLALSIGSCSFDEPREDLCELGWLSAA